VSSSRKVHKTILDRSSWVAKQAMNSLTHWRTEIFRTGCHGITITSAAHDVTFWYFIKTANDKCSLECAICKWLRVSVDMNFLTFSIWRTRSISLVSCIIYFRFLLTTLAIQHNRQCKSGVQKAKFSVLYNAFILMTWQRWPKMPLSPRGASFCQF